MATKMLSRRLLARPLSAPMRSRMLRSTNVHQIRSAGTQTSASEEEHFPVLTPEQDPNMNGGYVNPPRIKRQFRDPHANWWDKQERRNFGEPLHEDNDILGVFSLEEHTHYKPGMAFFMIGCFAAAVVTLYTVVKYTYPDRPAVPKEYPGGLEAELGGPKAKRARMEGDSLD